MYRYSVFVAPMVASIALSCSSVSGESPVTDDTELSPDAVKAVHLLMYGVYERPSPATGEVGTVKLDVSNEYTISIRSDSPTGGCGAPSCRQEFKGYYSLRATSRADTIRITLVRRNTSGVPMVLYAVLPETGPVQELHEVRDGGVIRFTRAGPTTRPKGCELAAKVSDGVSLFVHDRTSKKSALCMSYPDSSKAADCGEAQCKQLGISQCNQDDHCIFPGYAAAAVGRNRDSKLVYSGMACSADSPIEAARIALLNCNRGYWMGGEDCEVVEDWCIPEGWHER